MKKILLILSLLVLLTCSSPVSAEAFSLKDSLSGVKSFIQQKIQRFYLRLPGSKSGEAVLQQMSFTMVDVESVSFTSSVKAELSDDRAKMADVELEISGSVEATPLSPELTKQDLNIKGSLSLQGTTVRGDLDIKQDGEDVYIKVNEMPFLPMVDLRELNGRWFKVESGQMIGEEERSEDVSDEQVIQLRERFMQAFENSEISKAEKEDLDGYKVFKVEVEIPDEEIISYAQDVNQITNPEDESMTLEELEEMKEFLEAVSDFKVELWIDRSSFYLRRMALPMEIEVSQLGGEEVIEEDDSVSANPLAMVGEVKRVKLEIVGDFVDYNTLVEFEVPSEVEDFEEVMNEIMMEAMGVAAGEEAGFQLQPPVYKQPAELNRLTPAQKAMLKRLEK